MNSFLQRIAQKFYDEYGQKISETVFVFPNRRAGLFFRQYLAETAVRPLFSPEILTINECFAMGSRFRTADRLEMLFMIYQIFRTLSNTNETFDSFVYWGEMLLADFNEIDKYRIDAQQIFTNITELHDIDRIFNIFTPVQLEAIKKFWKNFIPVNESQTSRDFISTWKILYPLYEQFRQKLAESGKGTEGMILRDVTDRLMGNEEIEVFANRRFVFIGFNALNPCEKILMKELQKRSQADFYWDYDAPALHDPENPASTFFAENTTIFPSKFPLETIENYPGPQTIELIGVPSAVGQAKEVYALLDKLFPEGDTLQHHSWINTAIVLPDENLLLPMLSSFPPQIGKINITMGFPLRSTPLPSLIKQIFELHKRAGKSGNTTLFYHQNVLNILHHQYISMLCGDEVKKLSQSITTNNKIYIAQQELSVNQLLKVIFRPVSRMEELIGYLLDCLRALQDGWSQNGKKTEDQLTGDILYQYYNALNRFNDIIRDKFSLVDMSIDTLMRLIQEVTGTLTLPFIGEPLNGLQVMGVLETRGLDFENLIITSFNEGVFPANGNINSFIPYNLRQGFGLPTGELHDAITTYNFYRLIHQARNIFFIYDTRNDGNQTGEVSRFIYQLRYHYGVDVKERMISFDLQLPQTIPISIQKTPEIMQKLYRFTLPDDDSPALSASIINHYIDCPLKFYLSSIESVLKDEDKVTETVEADMFGNIFHKIMENIYRPFVGKTMHAGDFDLLLKDEQGIESEILKAFNALFYKQKGNAMQPVSGNNLLIAAILKKYIRQVILTDKNSAPLHITGIEKKLHYRLVLFDGQLSVHLKGIIDRIDEKEDRIRILDYKTGTKSGDFNNLTEVFSHHQKKRASFVLQTFLYGILFEKESAGKPIVPGILYLRETFRGSFGTELKNKEKNSIVTDLSEYRQEFEDHLRSCLEEMFSPETPFFQTENMEYCQYCPYKDFCGR